MMFYEGFNHTFYKGYTINRIFEDGKCKYYAQDDDILNQPKTKLYDDIEKLKWDIDHYQIILN
jgi:hypothetical protein